jgi:hypothetical protein
MTVSSQMAGIVILFRRSREVDEFQLTTIIAKAISTCAAEGQGGETLPMTSEHATCLAKVVIMALSKAGLEIAPITKTARPA